MLIILYWFNQHYAGIRHRPMLNLCDDYARDFDTVFSQS